MNNKLNVISITTGTILRFFLIVIALFLFWYLRDLFFVLLASIVIASFMESAVPFLKRIKLGRVFGLVILYFIIISFLVFLFYIFAPLLITEVYNLSVFLSQYEIGVDFINYFNNEAFSGASDLIEKLPDNFSLNALLNISDKFLNNLSGGFFTTMSVAFGSLFNLLLLIIISFYLSIQEKGIENFLRIILPNKYENYIVDLWNRSQVKIALWLKGQLVLALIVMVLIYLLLTLFGIKYALLLAILAGIMEIIPYGIWVAAIPAFSISYLSGDMGSAIVVLAVYTVVHQFESFLFAPLLIKRVTGLSPLVVILALLIGYELASIWGIVLSIPVAVILMEVMNDLEKKKFLENN